MQPHCNRYVPGYGATDADFHVIGDHPGNHGGLSTGTPFTDRPWSPQFFDALRRGGLVADVDLDTGTVETPKTYFSYLHMCESEDGKVPSERSYHDLEPFFDAEMRAITAHILFPVGRQATEHVFREYTAIDASQATEMDAIHANELHGSGWLIVPIKEPAEWTDEDEQMVVETIQEILSSDYRQISDLGRFTADGDPHFVR